MMNKIVTLIIIGLLFSGCSNDDEEEIDCSLFDPAFPTLFVRLVDTAGANLIENGTIDSNNINIEGNFSNAGFQFIPANEFAGPDAEIREFDNSLNLFIPQESSFRYNINLENFETISLDFTAELTRIPCNITYFKPIEVNVNNEEIELMEISPLQYLVIIEI